MRRNLIKPCGSALLFFMFLWLISSANADLSLIYRNNFEGTTPLADFTISGSPTYGSTVVTDDPLHVGSGNHVLKISDSSVAGGLAVSVDNMATRYTDYSIRRFKISVDFMLSSTSTMSQGWSVLRSQWGPSSSSSTLRDMVYGYYGPTLRMADGDGVGGHGTPLPNRHPLLADVWYRLKYIADFTTNTYTYTYTQIDSDQVIGTGSGLHFLYNTDLVNNPATVLSRIVLNTFTSTSGDVYYDNINVEAYTATGSVNLLPNASFENLNGNNIQGWSTTVTASNRTGTYQHGGNYSLQLNGTGANVVTSPSPAIPTLLPNTLYVMRSWVKADQVAGTFSSVFGPTVWQIKPSPVTGFSAAPSANAWSYISNTSPDWVLMEQQFKTAPANNQNRFDMGWGFPAGQTGWVDDVSLNAVGDFGSPTQIILVSKPMCATANGVSNTVIEARIADNAGNTVPTATNTVTFSLNGDGTFLGASIVTPVNGVAQITYASGFTLTTSRIIATATGVTSASTNVRMVPPSLGTGVFSYGIYEDYQEVYNTTTFDSLLADLATRHMDTILITNGDHTGMPALLGIAHTRGFKVLAGPFKQVYSQWYDDPTVTVDVPTAQSIIQPMVNTWTTYPSFLGWNLRDEPLQNIVIKTQVLNQAFRSLDPAHPTGVVLNGSAAQSTLYYDLIAPDIHITDDYPVRLPYLTPGGWVRDYIQRIRQRVSTVPAGQTYWMCLQAHGCATPTLGCPLRYPVPAELRVQQWISVGEGAKGLMWYIYKTQQWWIGLEDNPSLLAEVTTLSSRIHPMRPLLATLQKGADLFSVTSSGQDPYVSTLTDMWGTDIYAVAVNGDCVNNQTLTLSATTLNGPIQDLETGTVYNPGSGITFPAGDGKVFRFVNNNPNLVTNGSFETDVAEPVGTPDGWSSQSWLLRDTAVLRTGNASIKISGAVASPNNYAYPLSLMLVPNATYEVHAWIRTSNVSPNPSRGVALAWLETSGSPAQIQTASVINNGSTWQQLTLSFTTSPVYSDGRVELVFTLADGETAWVDDVEVKRVR